MRFEFPGGKKKALTFSYDDGQIFDRKLVDIFNSYNLKSTFHLNSGKLKEDEGGNVYLEPEEIKELFKNHEVAVHGVKHLNPPTLSPHQLVMEIEEDRKALELMTGTMVQGMSYAFGGYNEQVIAVAKSLGIKYSRTVNSTGGFFPPGDFMEWHPTCHHDDERLMELGRSFLNVPEYVELPLMYVWGHSFEFGNNDNFEVMEEFAKLMSGKDDIWYATNLEIYEYIQAVRSQEFSADGRTIKNPTATTIYISTAQGQIEVKPGMVKYLGEH